jgi:hypothetical protein
MTTTRQASRLRSARAKLVTDEALKLAQLANKRDKNKLAHKQDIVRSIILKVNEMEYKFITITLIGFSHLKPNFKSFYLIIYTVLILGWTASSMV